MIAFFDSPSKLEGVAAAGGRGRVSTEFHVGANNDSPLTRVLSGKSQPRRGDT